MVFVDVLRSFDLARSEVKAATFDLLFDWRPPVEHGAQSRDLPQHSLQKHTMLHTHVSTWKNKMDVLFLKFIL
jgi:hypothetical protein